jgi:argininosuccinate lyase
MVVKGLPLAYNKDLQEDKEALFDAVDTVRGCTDIAAEMVAATRFRTERMAAFAAADFSTATDLADHLAQQGLPFREAHHVVGTLVRYCQAEGRDLPDLSLAELRRFSPLFDEAAVGVDARRSVETRRSLGGTAPEQVAAALARAEARSAAAVRWVEERRAAHPTVAQLLERPWDAPS